MTRFGFSRWWMGASAVLIPAGVIICCLGIAQPPHWRGINASLGIMIVVLQVLFLVFGRYPFRDVSLHREDRGAVE